MISKSNPVHLSIILALVNYIAAHSWIDCVDVKDDHSCGGYIRGYDGHIDLHQTYKLLGRPNDSPICSPARQAHPDNYDDQYPRAVAEPGDTLKFFYLENGHVTKDRLAPDGRPNPKQYTIHWTGKPFTGDRLEGTQIMTRGELGPHNQLGPAQNFDDGKCAEDNTRGRAGPLPCQGKITLPTGIAPGIYQFIWFWKFDKDFKGNGEEYTSCFDVEVAPKGTKSAYISKKQSGKEAYLPKPYQPYRDHLNMTMDKELGTFMGSSRLGALPKFSMEDIHASGTMSRNDIPSNPPSDRIWQQLIGEIRAASVKPQVPVQVPASVPASPAIQAASMPMPQAPAVRMPQAPAPMPPSAPQPLPAAPQLPAPRMPQLPAPASPPAPVQAQSLPASPQAMPQMQPAVASAPLQKAPSTNSQLNVQSVPPVVNGAQQPMMANTAPSANAGDVSSRAAELQPAPAKPAAVPQADTQQKPKGTDTQAAKVQMAADDSAPQQKSNQSQTGSKAASSEKMRALPAADGTSQRLQTVPNGQKQLSPQEVTEAEKNIISLQNGIKGQMDSFRKSQADMASQNDPSYENTRLRSRPGQEVNQVPSRSGEEMISENDIDQDSVLTDRLLEEDQVTSWDLANTRSAQRPRIPISAEQMERLRLPASSQLPSQEAGPLSRQDLEMTRGQDSDQLNQNQHSHSQAPERFEMANERDTEPRSQPSGEGMYPFQINGNSDLVDRTKPFAHSHEDSQFNGEEPSQRMRPHMHPQEESNNSSSYPPPHEHNHQHHHHNHGEPGSHDDHQHETESEPHHGHQHQAESEPHHDHHHETELSDDQAPQSRMLGFPGAQPPMPPMFQGPHAHGPEELDPRLAQARIAPIPNEMPQMMPPMPMPGLAPVPMPMPPQAPGQPMPAMRSAPGLRAQGAPRAPGSKRKLRASGSEDEMDSEESEEGEDLLTETADSEASGANIEETSSQPASTGSLSGASTDEKAEMPIQKPGPHNGPKLDSQDEIDMENASASTDSLESSQAPRENNLNPSLQSSSKLVNEGSGDTMELPLSKGHNAPLVDEADHDLSLSPEINHSRPSMDESEQEMSLPLLRGHNRPLAEESEQNSPLTPENRHNRPLMEESEQEPSLPLSLGHNRPLVGESEQELPLASEMNHKPLMEESEQEPSLPLSRGHNRPLSDESELDLPSGPEVNHNKPLTEESDESPSASHIMASGKPITEDIDQISSIIPPMNPAKPLSEEIEQSSTPTPPTHQPKFLHEDLEEESPSFPAIDTQVPSVAPHQTNVNTMEAIPDATNLQSPLPETMNSAPAPSAQESTVEPQFDSASASAQPATADTLLAPLSEVPADQSILPE
ncbi:hypothetical protein CONCODRAFT_67703 [Conidiobolus coronatus NRRL 28638]|uniref:DUF7492 domain-containing protein n=1 Tax=Conidiobolus coronatus (strain ATCC 28846 / CBS 209.66 / NRRL 28638) TaxID=796925 RepID=A0A137PGG9_CONC2|nr:hypothetical protein CONCODRAFT_67703 [Conidiobolus coronatus NRRL 28638]|eukprot:KXN74096.1 hypothetical protein CONCODRAFT_67703 [Conidiobolus coronatus NRRL 28638]